MMTLLKIETCSRNLDLRPGGNPGGTQWAMC